MQNQEIKILASAFFHAEFYVFAFIVSNVLWLEYEMVEQTKAKERARKSVYISYLTPRIIDIDLSHSSKGKSNHMYLASLYFSWTTKR